MMDTAFLPSVAAKVGGAAESCKGGKGVEEKEDLDMSRGGEE